MNYQDTILVICMENIYRSLTMPGLLEITFDLA